MGEGIAALMIVFGAVGLITLIFLSWGVMVGLTVLFIVIMVMGFAIMDEFT